MGCGGRDAGDDQFEFESRDGRFESRDEGQPDHGEPERSGRRAGGCGDSHAAAEVRVREADIRIANMGCDSSGGYIATRPHAVKWHEFSDGCDGVVGEVYDVAAGAGIWFRAVHQHNGDSAVDLLAC